jgi:hypothetical protein
LTSARSADRIISHFHRPTSYRRDTP